MMEMVERMARAIWDDARADDDRFNASWRDAPLSTWEELSVKNRQAWMRRARAAIRAMREPTEAMLAAGSADSRDWRVEAEATWHDMIDAALGTDSAQESDGAQLRESDGLAPPTPQS